MRVATVIAALMVLVSCGLFDEGESASPEPENSGDPASDSPPEMPRAAEDDTDSGAIAFVKYYVEVLNHAAVNGDTDELSRLSASGCEGCQEYIELYEETYEDGGYFKGGEWELSDLEVEEMDEGRRVYAHMTSDSASYKAESNDTEEHRESDEAELIFETERSDVRNVMAKIVRNE